MALIRKTWPYGTKRRGKVVYKQVAGAQVIMSVIDDQREGHILLTTAADASAEVGDQGTLTFTKGGPTGGFWKFTKDTALSKRD